jgi:hypothetical protein
MRSASKRTDIFWSMQVERVYQGMIGAADPAPVEGAEGWYKQMYAHVANGRGGGAPLGASWSSSWTAPDALPQFRAGGTTRGSAQST